MLTDRMLDEGILSNLDEKTKEDIRKGAGEVGSLVAQLALGKVGHAVGRKTVPSLKAKAFKSEIAKEVPELRRGSERVFSINDVSNKTINEFVSKHGRSKAKKIIKESLEKKPAKTESSIEKLRELNRKTEEELTSEQRAERDRLAKQAKVDRPLEKLEKEAQIIKDFKEEVKSEIPETKTGSQRIVSIDEVPADTIKSFIQKHGRDGAKAVIKTSLETADGIKKQIKAGKTPEQIGREMSQSVKKIEEPVETRTTGTAEAVEARAIEKKLVDKVEDKAKFEPTKFKNQSERVADIINNDPARARRIVRGEEALPENINSGAMIQGVQLLAERTGNSKIIKELANSPLAKKISEAAQELGSARLIERDSVYKDMSDLKRFREKKAEATTKKTKDRLVKEMKKEQEKVNLSKKEVKSFDRFLEKIEC
jgi:predicted lactoylglutathione lyase